MRRCSAKGGTRTPARSSAPSAPTGKNERSCRPGQPARRPVQDLQGRQRVPGPLRRGVRATSNTAAGLPRDWPVEADERAAIRSNIARDMFVETYGREPIDARELSGHLARISRQATTAVAGYDLTFSPVKSVSTLWAIAPREVSAVIEQAATATPSPTP